MPTPIRQFVVLKVVTILRSRNVRIVGDIVVIGNVNDRDAANVLKELLGFVSLMAVGDDVRSRAAIKGHETNFSAQRKFHVFVYIIFLLFQLLAFLIDFFHSFTSHGGGKRCKMEGCSKSAVGGSHFCTGHGGGKRCQVPGCDKSAQSSTKFCVKHGGGKKCQHQGCEKVARGKTMFCAAHGGGVRCKLEGCNRVAIGKAQLCRAHGGGSKLAF